MNHTNEMGVGYMGMPGLKSKVTIKLLYQKQFEMVDNILDTCCNFYNVGLEALRGKDRYRPIVLARQTSCFFLRKKTNLSFKEIGVLIGNKDHTTVIHSIRTIKDQIETNEVFRKELCELETMIN